MAITVVQVSTVANWVGGTTASPSLTGVTSGNTLIAVYSLASFFSPPGSVSVNDGSAYSIENSQTVTGDTTYNCGIARLGNVGAGTHTAVCTSNGASTYGNAILVEVSGIQNVVADKLANNTGSSTTPTSGSTGTLSQANEIIFSVLVADSSLSGFTYPPTGYTGLFQDSGFCPGAACYQIVAANTALNTSWGTASTTTNWGACAATLLALAAGTYAPPPFRTFNPVYFM